ncbi:MAG: hypothetical protein JWO77_1274 [Ilumatobacteraceae bacterium]|nr:hypothetical protein [Ilumatobacteraceae bacterium]
MSRNVVALFPGSVVDRRARPRVSVLDRRIVLRVVKPGLRTKRAVRLVVVVDVAPDSDGGCTIGGRNLRSGATVVMRSDGGPLLEVTGVRPVGVDRTQAISARYVCIDPGALARVFAALPVPVPERAAAASAPEPKPAPTPASAPSAPAPSAASATARAPEARPLPRRVRPTAIEPMRADTSLRTPRVDGRPPVRRAG